MLEKIEEPSKGCKEYKSIYTGKSEDRMKSCFNCNNQYKCAKLEEYHVALDDGISGEEDFGDE